MGDGDAQMGEDPAPAPLQPFGGGPSGDWGAEVEAEHEASGRNASVLEAEREKARARAERFNTEYKAPSAKTLAGANGLLSRKEVLAVRREQAEKKAARGGQFITGIDLFDPEEEAKRAARAAKFGAMLELTPEQKALREKAEAERQAREAGPKSAAPASAGEDAPVGDDAAMDAEAAPPPKADILEERVDPELDAVWRNDAVHLYGVDHMTTADCMGYFGEYGPVFCEWINDSSCNVVFSDEHAARRAIRMKGQTMGAFANPDGKAALPEGLEAEMLWHSGPEFHTKGKTLQLSFRLATEDDIKPHGKIKSRYLWLGGKGGRGGRGKRRRGDDTRDRGDGRDGRRDGRRDDEGGGRRKRRRGGMRAFGDDGDDGGVGDLREKLKKPREERAAAGGGDAPMEATREAPAPVATSDAAPEARGGDAPMN